MTIWSWLRSLLGTRSDALVLGGYIKIRVDYTMDLDRAVAALGLRRRFGPAPVGSKVRRRKLVVVTLTRDMEPEELTAWMHRTGHQDTNMEDLVAWVGHVKDLQGAQVVSRGTKMIETHDRVFFPYAYMHNGAVRLGEMIGVRRCLKGESLLFVKR